METRENERATSTHSQQSVFSPKYKVISFHLVWKKRPDVNGDLRRRHGEAEACAF